MFFQKMSELSILFCRRELYRTQSVSVWVGGLHFPTWNYCHSALPELVSQPVLSFLYNNSGKKGQQCFWFCFVCVVPVKMVCGGVKVWLVLLPPLPVWKQSLLVLGGAASHPTGCVTMRTTVVMGLMKSASRPALQTSSAVQAHQGDSSINSSFLFTG